MAHAVPRPYHGPDSATGLQHAAQNSAPYGIEWLDEAKADVGACGDAHFAG